MDMSNKGNWLVGVSPGGPQGCVGMPRCPVLGWDAASSASLSAS